MFYSTSSCFSAKSKTIIVSYVTVSVYSSSCNYLFFRLMFASVLSISTSWCHQDIIRTQSIERKKKIKRERGQKPNNYLNCKLRYTKMVKFGTTALGSPLILKNIIQIVMFKSADHECWGVCCCCLMKWMLWPGSPSPTSSQFSFLMSTLLSTVWVVLCISCTEI